MSIVHKPLDQMEPGDKFLINWAGKPIKVTCIANNPSIKKIMLRWGYLFTPINEVVEYGSRFFDFHESLNGLFKK